MQKWQTYGDLGLARWPVAWRAPGDQGREAEIVVLQTDAAQHTLHIVTEWAGVQAAGTIRVGIRGLGDEQQTACGVAFEEQHIRCGVA